MRKVRKQLMPTVGVAAPERAADSDEDEAFDPSVAGEEDPGASLDLVDLFDAARMDADPSYSL
jgi:hypothetical protein